MMSGPERHGEVRLCSVFCIFFVGLTVSAMFMKRGKGGGYRNTGRRKWVVIVVQLAMWPAGRHSGDFIRKRENKAAFGVECHTFLVVG